MSKKLIIKIRKDGVVEAETKGIKGQKCEDYLKIIEELTDSKVVKKEYTPEYYEKEMNTQNKEFLNKNYKIQLIL